MSRTRKSIIFLVLAFVLSLLTLGMAWQQGMRDMMGSADSPPVFQLSIFCPAIAAVICSIVFERGQCLKALGLRLVPNWWWLAALLVPAGLGAISIAASLIADGASPFEPAGWTQAIASTERSDINAKFPNLATALVVMILINTLTEELGWRGYLYHLWQPRGFLHAALIPGIAQGVWHWPLVIMFGLGFTGNTMIDLAIYPVFTGVLGIYHALFRERGASVLAAGIFHGVFNVIASSTYGPGNNLVMPLVVAGAAAIVWFQRRS